MTDPAHGPYRAEMRKGTADDGSPLYLWVDPVSLAALAASKEAGGGTGYGALPDIEEVPLRIVVIEARLEQLERAVGRRTASGDA